MIVGHIGGGQSDGYQVQRSLRFRSSASAWLFRNVTSTPADTNQLRKTYSMWVKRGQLGTTQELISSFISTSNFWGLYFSSDDRLCFTASEGGATQAAKFSAAQFRDPSAHVHVMLVTDTANATAEDRVQLYVNGTRITSWNTNTTPALNAITAAAFIAPNAGTWFLNIGRLANASSYFDGYIADPICVDGQALTPSSFGQINTNGNWTPKEYVGTYGTNGFRLKFDDPTSLTTLMADSSGNGNNWTASNISLTAGATYDSMLDAPLGGGGNERGNYATLNPLEGRSNKLAPLEANLLCYAFAGSNAYFGNRGSIGVTSGKWYWECPIGAKDTNAGQWMGVGIVSEATNWPAGFGLGSLSGGFEYLNDGSKWGNGTNTPGFGGVYVQNDVIGVALDCDSQTLAFYKNGVLQGTAFTSIGAGPFFPAIEIYRSASFSQGIYANFGQRPFSYTPPAGFKALHTGNLTSDTVTVSGSFTGNVSADGPAIWMNGAPETLTINGNAVTWGTHADKTAGGFKLRTSSASYNSSGSNTWTATVLSPSLKSAFRRQLAKVNP